MKTLKLAIPALMMMSAGAAGAQSVSLGGEASSDASGSTGNAGVYVEGSAGVDTQLNAEAAGDATEDAANSGLTIASEAEAEEVLRVAQGTEIHAEDGVVIGKVTAIEDKAERLVRVRLDDALETEVPEVTIRAEALTAADGNAVLNMTGAEFAAAVIQATESSASATN